MPTSQGEKNVVSGIPRGLCGTPRTRKKPDQPMSAEGPRDPERAGNTCTPNFLYRLYATLWLKACRFKLKVFF